MSGNVLYYGDNLDILRRYIDKESVDLVYLDPPFKSEQDYNILFAEKNGSESKSQIKAFEDTWIWDEAAVNAYAEVVQHGPEKVSQTLQGFRTSIGPNDMLAYLSMMAPRLLELKRVLKPTGSIYLHCDPTASHYLKILMDAVFGPINFRSEIVWRRTNSHHKLTRQYGPIHDTILFYSKGENSKFQLGFRPYTKAYIESRFTKQDERGRYQLNYLTGPGTREGQSGEPWRGFDPTTAGRHWAVPASLRPFLPEQGKKMTSHEKLEALYKQGLIVFPKKKGGQPMYKQYMGPGVPYQDMWAYQPNTHDVLFGSDGCIDEDVKYLEHEDEKLGFETQKPLGLLERIIRASSDEGDVVLDPFCGCGTTVSAAHGLNRRWIGIDITYLAIALIKHRLESAYEGKVEYQVVGEPVSLPDAEALAKQDPYQFQWWALGLVGARPVEQKKGADRGIDGRLYFLDEPEEARTKQIIFSVKAGTLKPEYVRDLRGVIERENAAMGVLISFHEPTKAMRKEAAEAALYHSPGWNKKYPRIQLVTVAELLSGKGIQCPPSKHANVTFKKAPKAKRKKDQTKRLPLY